MGMEQNLTAELDAICQNCLTDALLDMARIIEGIRKELGFEQEVDKCIFTEHQPLQVTIAYDNEIRNQAVNWMKTNGYEISSYLGQPLLKLKNVRIVIKRVLKS